jgi:hypothetical protein
MGPDVARRPPMLAPNLAPTKLVSGTNDRPAEQAADPPPETGTDLPCHLPGAPGPHASPGTPAPAIR